MSKTREKFPLSTKKIMKKTIAKVFPLLWMWIFLFVLVPVIFMIVGDGEISLFSNAKEMFGTSGLTLIFVVGLLLIVVPTLLIYFYQRWYFATYFYDLTDDHVIIRKGPITPQEITIPYERIQALRGFEWVRI